MRTEGLLHQSQELAGELQAHVRIEDDVLVTATGCEVLTYAIPKTAADVEAAMRG